MRQEDIFEGMQVRVVNDTRPRRHSIHENGFTGATGFVIQIDTKHVDKGFPLVNWVFLDQPVNHEHTVVFSADELERMDDAEV